MKFSFTFALLSITYVLGSIQPAWGQENAESAEQAKREAAFGELLTRSKMVGYFTDFENPGGELRGDSYTLKSVKKIAKDLWRFDAVIEYGEHEIPISMNLPVLWAGDSPVISVTDKVFPLLGTYSARVLFSADQYVGVWNGVGYGGHMFGSIVSLDAEDSDAGEDIQLKSLPAEDPNDTNWPSFRGPHAVGVAEGYSLPTEWDIEEGTNVLWRAEVPGLAHSSPVIWGDKLFVTTAIRLDGEQELRVGLYGDIASVEDTSPFAFEIYCYDKNTGELEWSETCWEGVPKFKRHTKGSFAAPSPACDGERVLAFFGTEGLYCYDHSGELLWKKDLGDLDSGYYLARDAEWGFSSSPVLFGDLAIVQCDIQEGSFLCALDAATGEERWRTPREENPTWSTPTVHVSGDRSQVICNGFKHIGGYDLATGEELWKLVGGGDIPVPTPVVAQDLIFITNAHGAMAPIYAIDANATGTLTIDPKTTEAMVWSSRNRGNYMQTPLAYGEEIYFCSDGGILSCYDIATGEQHYRERIGLGQTGFSGSGVAADGKLYFCSEEGDVYVVQAGIDFEALARNPLGEECMSCPAISAGVLYYRSRDHLVALKQ